jgi:hypothetical protein
VQSNRLRRIRFSSTSFIIPANYKYLNPSYPIVKELLKYLGFMEIIWIIV